MNIEAIESSTSFLPVSTPSISVGTTAVPANFESMMLEGISEVNEKMKAANTQLQALASGQVDNLHDAMMTMEQARLSFQFLAQVRNRFMDAYQQLMQMQI